MSKISIDRSAASPRWRAGWNQNPQTNKSAKEQCGGLSENELRAKSRLPNRVLADRPCCLGAYLAAHRGRFAIAAPTETPGVPKMRRVRKRVVREGYAAEKCSAR
jgi:hypothetical protein